MSGREPRVALCCDVGPAEAADHLLRCLALADELVTRGVEVTFVCAAESMPWAWAQIAARGLQAVPPGTGPEEHLRLLESLGVHAVVCDSPRLGAEVCVVARRGGLATLAIVDGDPGGTEADVLVDPSVRPEGRRAPAAENATVLAGPDYALMRNDVLAHRPVSAPTPTDVEAPRVVVVLDDAGDTDHAGDAGDTDHTADTADADDAGDTDHADHAGDTDHAGDAGGTGGTGYGGAAPAAARLLAGTGRPFEATFVTSSPRARAGLGDVRLAPRQRVDVVEPDLRVHARVARADVVLATAGPLTCEWLCLGVAAALVWAEEDRVDQYRALMVRRAVVGLGSAAALVDDPEAATDKASRLLGDAAERARLAETAWRLVDGLGRARVADALLGLL